jgi:tRNA pseudouridine38-40 synthase
MPHWSLTLAYDGTAFHGWQVQPSLPTIQGTLAATLKLLTGEIVLPQGAGRTDTGVHALGQVASFTLQANIPPTNLLRALNRALPPSIRILRAEHAAPHFHARHSAVSKTYEYRIFPRTPQSRTQPDRICPPTLAPYVWDCPWPIDLTQANRAASHILGTHDFLSFAASDPDQATRSAESKPPTVKTIHHSAFTLENDVILYRVSGSGFLHHMVRNLVGTFVDAASARLDPDAIPHILAQKNRTAAGPTAPARGLFLVSVVYPENYRPSTDKRFTDQSLSLPEPAHVQAVPQ